MKPNFLSASNVADVTGRVINSKNIQEPEQGSDLYLSIDLALQKKAESARCHSQTNWGCK
jgi:cell division protein FtsI/penicillin-binding protein 2